VVLRVWLYYGVPGAVLFSTLFFTAFARLFKCWLARKLTPEQQLLRGMLTAWSGYYVYVWMVGYSLHPPEVFFTMLFFSEIGRLKGKCLITTNTQLRRTAA
jgi:O-antigen ligase